ncbi:uncharacterized protein G2W53_000890 [Senna tora]|uniref:Uncharacterized protein n=1 Tax=Senna tora TaxID=362788 RepID=A0A834XEJ4_9FABA|nr:uncharacterized protein G2W53_000890 [Senna tora]
MGAVRARPSAEDREEENSFDTARTNNP